MADWWPSRRWTALTEQPLAIRSVADGGLEDRRHPAVDQLDRAWRQHRSEPLHPRVQVASADGAQLARAEVRVRVQPEVGLDLRGRAGAVDLHRPPPLGVLLEQSSGRRRSTYMPCARSPRMASRYVALAGEVTGPSRGRPGTPANGPGTARRDACRCWPSAPPHSPRRPFPASARTPISPQ